VSLAVTLIAARVLVLHACLDLTAQGRANLQPPLVVGTGQCWGCPYTFYLNSRNRSRQIYVSARLPTAPVLGHSSGSTLIMLYDVTLTCAIVVD
jgi:hypothetical protein